jgi:hypothetical protein
MNPVRLALCVNPMSGRDVRRLAARASNMTHEAKRDMVARVAAGAEAVGVTDLYISREPFRIASLALQHMGLDVRVHVVETEISNDARDTERALHAFIEAGCTTIVTLGGDGTNRALVRAHSDVQLIPLSTGTNNVFPTLIEPTIAGMVAGMAAAGRLPEGEFARRCKVLRVKVVKPAGAPGKGRVRDSAQQVVVEDVGLIDAVQLRDDHIGNLLPFDAQRIERILLTRAEPDAIGMSPIGGFIDVVDAAEDCGLLVEMGPGRKFRAPLSPGLFRQVSVRDVTRIPFGVPVIFSGPGVLALDGDRDYKLGATRSATITIARDGPQVFDVPAAMRYAVGHGMIGPPLR